MTKRVMLYVQHLLGVGHLKRMALLADGLAEAGAEVMLVSGGFPAAHIRPGPKVGFAQLPPVAALDENFSALAGADGRVLDEAGKTARRDLLLTLFRDFAPDILIVELFPLGRRQLRFELLPLLEAARPVTARIACSVRDIVNRRPRREAEALDWLNRFFDLLLVHGDGVRTPISDSFATIDGFRGRLAHTGYLAAPPPAPAQGQAQGQTSGARGNEILTTAGGGAAGEGLFAAAAEASRLTGPGPIWRIRHHAGAPPQMLADWRAAAHPSAIIEPVAGDFHQYLRAAALSVSQFGYNTAMDIFATATPAIVTPFEGGTESEQLRRAEALAGAGIRVLREHELTGERLAAAALDLIGSGERPETAIDMNGLTRSVEILLGA